MSRHSTHGFTILELLLVIVVLGAQAALLMPVLEAAKERDRASACQSNLKQCALVLRMYSDDYDGTLPASALVANPPSQAQVVNFLTGKGEPFPKPAATEGLTWAQFSRTT